MANRLSSWGLSMYGGYYAQVWIGDKYTGLHTEKLSELRKQLAELGIAKLNKDLRWDN